METQYRRQIQTNYRYAFVAAAHFVPTIYYATSQYSSSLICYKGGYYKFYELGGIIFPMNAL